MTIRALGFSLLLAAALSGCGTGASAPAAVTSSPPVLPPGPASVTPDARGWAVAASYTAASGTEPAQLTVRLTVRGPLTVDTGCGVSFGLNAWLTDTAGNRVTPPRVQNYMCTKPSGGVYTPTVIGAGEAQTYTCVITLVGFPHSPSPGSPLPAGTYVVHGQLSVDPASGMPGTIPTVTVTLP